MEERQKRRTIEKERMKNEKILGGQVDKYNTAANAILNLV